VNKRLRLIYIALVLVFLPKIGMASVENVKVSKGQVVTQQVTVTPGFAVMFEVPVEVVSFSIADQTSITCDKIPPDNNKILCKPLTINDFATNLIITTEHNEFNIILKISRDGKEHPFKYVFYDSAQKASLAQVNNMPLETRQSNILDQLLNDYTHEKCKDRNANAYVEIRCLEKIRLGTDSYLKFKIISRGKAALKIVKCDVVLQTLGGFTGLTIKSETPYGTEQALKKKTLSPNEETFGIIKIPNVTVKEEQQLVLSVYTDIGKEGDLMMRVK